jgi:hypothetical protein
MPGTGRIQAAQLFFDQSSTLCSASHIRTLFQPHPVCHFIQALLDSSNLLTRSSSSSAFPATYTGPLIHRGSILPSEHRIVAATFRASSAGQYALVGWRLEIDLGERQSSLHGPEWSTRARYLQEPSWSEDVVLVRSISSSA